MTLIPRKDDMNYDNNYEQPRVKTASRKAPRPNKWIKLMDETNVIGGLAILFVWGTGFLDFFTYPGFDLSHPSTTGLACPPLAITCTIISAILLIVGFMSSGITFYDIVKGIMSFIGGFTELEFDPDSIEKSREKDHQRILEKEARAKEIQGYAEKASNSGNCGGKTFNEMQKEKRKADAYKNADPEFIVTYKSKGGCWVKDIVRGRDKAELYARYKCNPMVEQMGGVVGIYE